MSTVHSLSKMERDHSQAINEHKTIVKQLNKKTDTSIEGMKQQHSAAIAKVLSLVIYCHLLNTTGKTVQRQS